MILVDIYIVSIDKTYDFNLDEETKIGTLTEEIGEMVAQKEKMALEERNEAFYLCSQKDLAILPQQLTLSQCHVRTGDYFFMV